MRRCSVTLLFMKIYLFCRKWATSFVCLYRLMPGLVFPLVGAVRGRGANLGTSWNKFHIPSVSAGIERAREGPRIQQSWSKESRWRHQMHLKSTVTSNIDYTNLNQWMTLFWPCLASATLVKLPFEYPWPHLAWFTICKQHCLHT